MTETSGLTTMDILQQYFAVNDLKAMLCTSALTFDPDTDTFRDDITDEVSGDGYTTGGTFITGATLTQNTADSRIEIRADPVEFDEITVTDATYLVVYLDTGDSSTDRIINVHEFPSLTITDSYLAYGWDNLTTKGVVGYIEY
jgi:hypothetical protein